MTPEAVEENEGGAGGPNGVYLLELDLFQSDLEKVTLGLLLPGVHSSRRLARASRARLGLCLPGSLDPDESVRREWGCPMAIRSACQFPSLDVNAPDGAMRCEKTQNASGVQEQGRRSVETDRISG